MYHQFIKTYSCTFKDKNTLQVQTKTHQFILFSCANYRLPMAHCFSVFMVYMYGLREFLSHVSVFTCSDLPSKRGKHICWIHYPGPTSEIL